MFKSSKDDFERKKFARKNLINPIMFQVINKRLFIDKLDVTDFTNYFGKKLEKEIENQK